MAILTIAGYKEIVHKEVQMLAQSKTKIIRWQDFKLMSEADLVLKLAGEKGWKDCKIFGHGDMITQPLDSMGWKLIPADLYEYSIPAEGVARILQIINAGVWIRGVIIADDERHSNPTAKTTKPALSLPPVKSVLSLMGKALLGLVVVGGVVMIGLTAVAGVIMLAPLFILSAATAYDPQLIILVDDGKGGSVWVSVYTWFD